MKLNNTCLSCRKDRSFCQPGAALYHLESNGQSHEGFLQTKAKGIKLVITLK